MQVAFFSNCDCDSVTVATRFYLFTLLPFLGNRLKFFSCV